MMYEGGRTLDIEPNMDTKDGIILGLLSYPHEAWPAYIARLNQRALEKLQNALMHALSHEGELRLEMAIHKAMHDEQTKH